MGNPEIIAKRQSIDISVALRTRNIANTLSNKQISVLIYVHHKGVVDESLSLRC